jgi:hypothetical protein
MMNNHEVLGTIVNPVECISEWNNITALVREGSLKASEKTYVLLIFNAYKTQDILTKHNNNNKSIS